MDQDRVVPKKSSYSWEFTTKDSDLYFLFKNVSLCFESNFLVICSHFAYSFLVFLFAVILYAPQSFDRF